MNLPPPPPQCLNFSLHAPHTHFCFSFLLNVLDIIIWQFGSIFKGTEFLWLGWREIRAVRIQGSKREEVGREGWPASSFLGC